MDMVLTAIAVILGLVALVIVVYFTKHLNLWLQALMSGAPVSYVALLAMRLRKIKPEVIVAARIQAAKAGIEVSTDQLQAHYLAGGSVRRVVQALIAAKKEGIDFTWEDACAIDLAGDDVVEAVKAPLR